MDLVQIHGVFAWVMFVSLTIVVGYGLLETILRIATHQLNIVSLFRVIFEARFLHLAYLVAFLFMNFTNIVVFGILLGYIVVDAIAMWIPIIARKKIVSKNALMVPLYYICAVLDFISVIFACLHYFIIYHV